MVNAYAQQGADPELVREEILEFFQKEVESPTDGVEGGVSVGDES